MIYFSKPSLSRVTKWSSGLPQWSWNIRLCSVSLISRTLTSRLRTAYPAADFNTNLDFFLIIWKKNRVGNEKCFISLSFSWRRRKNPHKHMYYLTPTSPPTVAPWLTQPHLRNRTPFLIQSTQIRLTLCKVSWKTDVARVTYRNLIIAFHCLAFPFYPFKSTYNGNLRMS